MTKSGIDVRERMEARWSVDLGLWFVEMSWLVIGH